MMVEHLQDRPPEMNVERWFAKLRGTANLNAEIRTERVSIGNLPALKVRYRNTASDTEMEEIYVISGSRTFAISFNNELSHASLERSVYYADYLKMVKTFAVN